VHPRENEQALVREEANGQARPFRGAVAASSGVGPHVLPNPSEYTFNAYERSSPAPERTCPVVRTGRMNALGRAPMPASLNSARQIGRRTLHCARPVAASAPTARAKAARCSGLGLKRKAYVVNDECQMTNDERMTNPKTEKGGKTFWSFVIRHWNLSSFVICHLKFLRHLAFVIRHWTSATIARDRR